MGTLNTKKYLGFAVIAFLAVALGSCSDDDYYYSPLIGDWVLVADDYGPVDTDQTYFNFYADGSGFYTDSDWGNQYTYPIYWDATGSTLYINFDDGQQWVYLWTVAGNTLYLEDVDTGSRLTFQMY